MIIARMYTDHSFRGWRAKPRKAMRLEIQASTGSEGARAIVRDLSEHGLRLETAAELAAGDQFEVNLPMAENVLAEVVWSDSNSHGCKFLRPVPKAVVSAAALLSPIDEGPPQEAFAPGAIDEFLDQTEPQASDKIWYTATAVLSALVFAVLLFVVGLLKSAAG